MARFLALAWVLCPCIYGFWFSKTSFRVNQFCGLREVVQSSKATSLLTTAVADRVVIDDDEAEQKKIEETMHSLFSEAFYEEVYGDTEPEESFESFTKRSASFQSKQLVENPSALRPGVTVELIYKGSIRFGHFLSTKTDSKAVNIQVSSGAIITVDSTQIIGIWNDLADEEPPNSPQTWADVTEEAMELLRNMSPRKSDLEEFWSLTLRRSSTVPVDSLDLAIYIFQEPKFRHWLNPHDDPGAGVRIYALTAAQRLAAALLLFHDDIHFKRRASTFAWPEDVIQDNDSSDEPLAPAYVIEGGYKVVDESIVRHRQTDLFEQYYQHRVSNNSDENTGFRSLHVITLLRQLEVFALSSPSANTAAPKPLRALFKRLKQPATVSGAQQILIQLGVESKGYAPRVVKGRTSSSSSSSQSSSSSSQSSSYVINITPWSPEVISAANLLVKEVQNQRQIRISLAGNSVPAGRRSAAADGGYDFRFSQNPAICLDMRKTNFYDDAVQLHPATGELLIHITDAYAKLEQASNILLNTAKERVSSLYLASGPLHMLPPQALEVLRLSPTSNINEVLTVALQIDFHTGEILNTRIFPAVIGAVVPVDINTANEIIDGSSTKKITGYTETVVKDLRMMAALVDRMVKRSPFLDSNFKSNSNSNNKKQANDGDKEDSYDLSHGHRIINSLLTAYSNATYNFCSQQNSIPVPLAWEQRDKGNNQQVRRFATQPLRNYVSLLQQKQIRAAMKLTRALTKAECAIAVSHHNRHRQQQASVLNRGRKQMAFEALESHCASSSNQQEAVVMAEGMGSGTAGQVRIIPFNVPAVLLSGEEIKHGEKIKVRIAKMIPEKAAVYVERV